MGAIAEAMVAFAQPLIDQTDGSPEQMEKMLSLSMLCYNLALLPEEAREESLKELQSTLGYSDEDFEQFRRDIVTPMLARHAAMFPNLSRLGGVGRGGGRSAGIGRLGESRFQDTTRENPYLGRGMLEPRTAKPEKKQPAPEPYEPCPCNSGKKYRFCCGKKR